MFGLIRGVAILDPTLSADMAPVCSQEYRIGGPLIALRAHWPLRFHHRLLPLSADACTMI
jgi:hypothetical protein